MQSRINQLARELARLGVDAAYIRNTPDIEWASGFEHTFDDERAHALLVELDAEGTAPAGVPAGELGEPGKSGEPVEVSAAPAAMATLHTDSRYSQACKLEAARIGGIAVDDAVVSHAKWAAHKLVGEAAASEGAGCKRGRLRYEYRGGK
jgi:Xaa-Pro aminopeptidase